MVVYVYIKYWKCSPVERSPDLKKYITANQNWCLSFDYNMFGKKMGELIIRSGASGSTVERWRMTGNQGRNWLQARIDVPAEQNLVVSLFEVYMFYTSAVVI